MKTETNIDDVYMEQLYTWGDVNRDPRMVVISCLGLQSCAGSIRIGDFYRCEGEICMKAMVYTEYGTTDVLKLEEVEKPTPKDNEVLIKVHAASVNSWDWDLLRGKPYLNRLGALLKPKYKVLGADVGGRVEAVGSDVKQFRPGDEVFGDISGVAGAGLQSMYVLVNMH